MFVRDKIRYAQAETNPQKYEQFQEITYGFLGNAILLIIVGCLMIIFTPFLFIIDYVHRK